MHIAYVAHFAIIQIIVIFVNIIVCVTIVNLESIVHCEDCAVPSADCYSVAVAVGGKSKLIKSGGVPSCLVSRTIHIYTKH